MNYFLSLEFSFLLMVLIFPSLPIIGDIFTLKRIKTVVLKKSVVKRDLATE